MLHEVYSFNGTTYFDEKNSMYQHDNESDEVELQNSTLGSINLSESVSSESSSFDAYSSDDKDNSIRGLSVSDGNASTTTNSICDCFKDIDSDEAVEIKILERDLAESVERHRLLKHMRNRRKYASSNENKNRNKNSGTGNSVVGSSSGPVNSPPGSQSRVRFIALDETQKHNQSQNSNRGVYSSGSRISPHYKSSFATAEYMNDHDSRLTPIQHGRGTRGRLQMSVESRIPMESTPSFTGRPAGKPTGGFIGKAVNSTIEYGPGTPKSSRKTHTFGASLTPPQSANINSALNHFHHQLTLSNQREVILSKSLLQLQEKYEYLDGAMRYMVNVLRDNNSSGKDISGNDTGLSDALRGEQNVEESHLNMNTMDEVRKGNVGSNEIKCPRVSLREQLLATPPVSPVTSNENASRQRPLGTLMGTVVGGYDSDDPINMSNLDDNWKSQCSISSDTQTPSHAHTQTDVWTESSSVSETDISVNSIRRSRSSTHNKMKAYKGKLKSSCSKRNMKVDQSHNEHQEVSATLEPLGKGWHVGFFIQIVLILIMGSVIQLCIYDWNDTIIKGSPSYLGSRNRGVKVKRNSGISSRSPTAEFTGKTTHSSITLDLKDITGEFELEPTASATTHHHQREEIEGVDSTDRRTDIEIDIGQPQTEQIDDRFFESIILPGRLTS